MFYKEKGWVISLVDVGVLGLAFSFGCWQAFAFVFPGFIGSWHFVSLAGKLVFLLLPFQNRDFENSIPTTLLTCK